MLARADGESPNPSRRVGQSYVSAVAFLAVLTVVALLVVSVLCVYVLFAIAGPGVFGSFGGRGAAFRLLIEAVYLGLVAALVL